MNQFSFSNPKVQIAVLNEGIFESLVNGLSWERDSDVRKKYLFAIASNLRHFPFAQRKLMDLGGVDMLLEVLRDRRTAELSSKKRVLALFYDLLVERKNLLNFAKTEEDAQKSEQYSEAPLRNALIDAGLCGQLPRALKVFITFQLFLFF